MKASQSLKASISARGAPFSSNFDSAPASAPESLLLHFTSIPSPNGSSIPAAGWKGVKLAPWKPLFRLFSQSGQVTSATHSSSAKKPSAFEKRDERNSPYISPLRLSFDCPLNWGLIL